MVAPKAKQNAPVSWQQVNVNFMIQLFSGDPTEMAKDDAGECIPENKLKNAADNQQDASKQDKNAAGYPSQLTSKQCSIHIVLT